MSDLFNDTKFNDMRRDSGQCRCRCSQPAQPHKEVQQLPLTLWETVYALAFVEHVFQSSGHHRQLRDWAPDDETRAGYAKGARLVADWAVKYRDPSYRDPRAVEELCGSTHGVGPAGPPSQGGENIEPDSSTPEVDLAFDSALAAAGTSDGAAK